MIAIYSTSSMSLRHRPNPKSAAAPGSAWRRRPMRSQSRRNLKYFLGRLSRQPGGFAYQNGWPGIALSHCQCCEDHGSKLKAKFRNRMVSPCAGVYRSCLTLDHDVVLCRNTAVSLQQLQSFWPGLMMEKFRVVVWSEFRPGRSRQVRRGYRRSVSVLGRRCEGRRRLLRWLALSVSH